MSTIKKQYSIEELIQLKKESEEIMNDRTVAFNKRFKDSEDIVKPLYKWSENKLNEALENLKFSTADLESWALKTNSLNSSHVLFENDEFKVVGVIDYDYGYVLFKYSCTDKSSNLSFRNTKTLGKD